MGRAARKVKTVAPRRYRVTLEKYVTLRLTTTIDVDAETIEPATTQREKESNASKINRELKARLAAEKKAGIERQWSTQDVIPDPDDGPYGYSAMISCNIQEEPHITVTQKHCPVK